MNVIKIGHGRVVVAAAVLSLVASACGSAPTPQPTRQPTQKPAHTQKPTAAPKQVTSAPTPTPTLARPQVGTIQNVANPDGFVDTVRVNPGDSVFAQSIVSTSGSGSVRFGVINKIKWCTLTPASKVAIEPGGDPILSYIQGSTACTTVKSADPIVLQAGRQTELRMSDPVFVVTVTDEQATVSVLNGLIEVRNTSTGTDLPVYVGPDFRVEIFNGQDPAAPIRFDPNDLPPLTVKDVNAEVERTRSLPIERPEVGNSTVLKRMVDVGHFVIGIDDRIDDTGRAFIGNVRDFQSTAWRFPADSSTFSFESGVKALESGEIAMFVSRDPLPSGGGQLPFYLDQSDNKTPVWLLTDPGDPTFNDAERTFLQNLVNSGEYGALYTRAFDVAPDYAGVAGLFQLH